MSYVMVVLALATFFGLEAYEADLGGFHCGVPDPPVSLRKSWSKAARQGHVARELHKKCVYPRQEFEENLPTPTFKNPLRPPLFLFELFVQSEDLAKRGPARLAGEVCA